MSAFIVDKIHIDLMIRAALRASDGTGPRMGAGFRFWRTDENGDYAGWLELHPHAESMEASDYCEPLTPSQVGQLLVNENVFSVHHRYPDTDPNEGDLPGPCDAYYMGPYVYTDPRRDLTAGEVFKAIDCLDYQSCEHDGWRKSSTYAFCVALRDAYCRKVEGYDAAPWEFSPRLVA